MLMQIMTIKIKIFFITAILVISLHKKINSLKEIKQIIQESNSTLFYIFNQQYFMHSNRNLNILNTYNRRLKKN